MKKLLGLILVAGLLATSAMADLYTFQEGTNGYSGTDDLYIRGSTPDSNYGSSGTLYGRNDNIPILIRFSSLGDLSGLTVQDAKITFTQNTGAGGVQTATVYRVLRDWTETGATWNDYASGSAWQTAGALGANDAGAAITNTSFTLLTSTEQEVDIPLPSDLVQAWVDAPSSNQGVIIRFTQPNGGTTFAGRSSEYTTVAYRPELNVNAIPEPGSVLMLGLGVLSIGLMRRRLYRR